MLLTHGNMEDLPDAARARVRYARGVGCYAATRGQNKEGAHVQ
jgi:hypothetical protein